MQRNKEIKIRLTEEEHNKLLAEKTCAKLAQYVREKALTESENQITKKLDPDFLLALNRIGVNLNQIAKACNSLKRYGREEDVLTIASALHNIDLKISELLHYVSKSI